MPRNTDTTTEAQGRFTVALPKEFGPLVDAVGKRIGEAVHAETGVTVDLSRAQIVQSLIRSALASAEQAEASAVPAGE
jgi:hypothetical protein